MSVKVILINTETGKELLNAEFENYRVRTLCGVQREPGKAKHTGEKVMQIILKTGSGPFEKVYDYQVDAIGMIAKARGFDD